MPSRSDAAVGAQDATVEATGGQPDMSPVDRAKLFADEADDAVERLTRKLGKFEGTIDAIQAALAEAKAEQKQRHADLRAAEKEQRA